MLQATTNRQKERTVTTSPTIGVQRTQLRAIATSEPPPLSERLIRALEAHAAAESHDSLTAQQLASDSGDTTIGFLVHLIDEDQQRHHDWLESMVSRLQQEVELAPAVSGLPGHSQISAPITVELTGTARSLIRNAHEGARHLRHVARQESTLHGSLYPLLLETIARDCEKHAVMLRYVLRRFEEHTARG
jgi:hypothetical protein